jgi:hypothetical protein
MAIHESIEIGRSLNEVFDYACDANRLTEWQTHLVDVKTRGLVQHRRRDAKPVDERRPGDPADDAVGREVAVPPSPAARAHLTMRASPPPISNVASSGTSVRT